MYDFWYQPRHNTLVSSEWGAPNTFKDGFDPADVGAGKYGRHLHFWDLERRAKAQTIDLGDQFYPELRGWLTKLDRQADGTYAIDPEFFVDFQEQGDGARPHEIHLPGGDCTTEIFQ